MNFNLISQLNIDSANVGKPSSSIPGGSELAEQTENHDIVYFLKFTAKPPTQQKVN